MSHTTTTHFLVFGFDVCRSGNPASDKGTRDPELVTCADCLAYLASHPVIEAV